MGLTYSEISLENKFHQASYGCSRLGGFWFSISHHAGHILGFIGGALNSAMCLRITVPTCSSAISAWIAAVSDATGEQLVSGGNLRRSRKWYHATWREMLDSEKGAIDAILDLKPPLDHSGSPFSHLMPATRSEKPWIAFRIPMVRELRRLVAEGGLICLIAGKLVH